MNSEAGFTQLPARLIKNGKVSVSLLSLLTKISSPMASTFNPFNQLHEMTAEVPQPASTFQVCFSMRD